MVLVIDYLILFVVLISGMWGPSLSSCKLSIDLYSLPHTFQDVIDVKNKHYLALNQACLEELGTRHLGSVAKHVAQNKTNALVKGLVRQKLDVFMSIHSLG